MRINLYHYFGKNAIAPSLLNPIRFHLNYCKNNDEPCVVNCDRIEQMTPEFIKSMFGLYIQDGGDLSFENMTQEVKEVVDLSISKMKLEVRKKKYKPKKTCNC